MSKILLDTIDNTATASEFDFTGISDAFHRLVIEGFVRSDASVTADGLRLFMNTDLTDANYHFQEFYALSGDSTPNANDSDAAGCGISTGASSPSNSFAQVRFVLENYASSTMLKTARCYSSGYLNTDTARLYNVYLTSAITDAISRVRIRTDNHSTDKLFGVLYLYGEY